MAVAFARSIVRYVLCSGGADVDLNIMKCVQVGFRRIGNSHFFARAVDDNHPSRSIKAEDDAGYIVPAESKLSDAQRKAKEQAYA